MKVLLFCIFTIIVSIICGFISAYTIIFIEKAISFISNKVSIYIRGLF